MPICSYPGCNSLSAKKRDRCDAQISAVETAVLALRVANPGANAANNPGGNTLCGTANPVKTEPSPAPL